MKSHIGAIKREPEPENTLKAFYEISKIEISNLKVRDSEFLAKFVRINHQEI